VEFGGGGEVLVAEGLILMVNLTSLTTRDLNVSNKPSRRREKNFGSNCSSVSISSDGYAWVTGHGRRLVSIFQSPQVF